MVQPFERSFGNDESIVIYDKATARQAWYRRIFYIPDDLNYFFIRAAQALEAYFLAIGGGKGREVVVSRACLRDTWGKLQSKNAG